MRKFRVQRHIAAYYEYIVEATNASEAREIVEVLDNKLPLDIEEDESIPFYHQVFEGEEGDVLTGFTSREIERAQEIYKKYDKPQIDIEE